MVGYLVGGLLLTVADPRPLVAGCGLAGLLVVAAVAVPVRRAIRAERAAGPATADQPAAAHRDDGAAPDGLRAADPAPSGSADPTPTGRASGAGPVATGAGAGAELATPVPSR